MKVSLNVCVRIATAASCLTISACGTGWLANSPGLSPASRSAPDFGSDARQLSGHVYVAGSTSGSGSGFVWRYGIKNGTPDRKPDRMYASAGAPAALDSANLLYASNNNGTPTVEVYPPNSNQAIRTLTLWCESFCQIAALAIDAQGYLYVGYNYNYPISNKHFHLHEWQSWVWIFAPGAKGNATPVERIWIDSGGVVCVCVGGLALDRTGDLLVSSNGVKNVVNTFATPVAKPILIRTLTGGGIVHPFGLAIDGNELYVINKYGQSQGPFVSAYPVDANGNHKPDREIQVAGQGEIGIGIAVKADRLFVPDPGAGLVYEVDAKKRGTQKPIDTLNASSSIDVKLGR